MKSVAFYYKEDDLLKNMGGKSSNQWVYKYSTQYNLKFKRVRKT